MLYYRQLILTILVVISTYLVVFSQPTATLSGDYIVCPSTPQPLIVALTGTAPYQLVYSINGVEVSATVNTPNSYTIVANLQETTVFVLVSISDIDGQGVVNGFATVTVQQPPAFNNFVVNCNPDLLSYTISFDVTHVNLANVDISGIAGTYDNTTGAFISDPIPVGLPYSVQLTDLTLLCSNNTQQGPSPACTCDNSAGTFNITTLQLCANDTASIPPASGIILSVGDTQQYILLYITAPNPWTEIATNNTPEFVFNPSTMQYGVEYTIVSICGANVGGIVDLADPCFQISNPIPVTWNAPVTATMTGDTSICKDQPAYFELSIANGAPPYSLQYTASGVPQPIVVVPSNISQIQVNPNITTTYSATLITDSNGCTTGQLAGLEATITVVDTPKVSFPIVTNCDLLSQTYTYTFNITNVMGNLSNYTFTGDNGIVTGNSFTSLTKVSGSPYQVTVANAIGCSATISGMGPTCECTSDAGSLISTPLNVCVTQTAFVIPNNPSALDPEDALQYVLYTNIGTILSGGILATSTTPNFNYQLSWGTGITYYISAIVGNALPSGAVDINDPCLSISNAVAVTFRNLPTATITGAVTICAGENASFNVNFTGQGPFNFKYLLNGVESPMLTSTLNSFPISSSNIQENQSFSLTFVEDAFCVGTASGTATVTTKSLPELKLQIARNKICFGDTTSIKFQGVNINSFNAVLKGTDGSLFPLFNQNVNTINVITPTQNTTYTLTNVGIPTNNCPLKLDSTVSVVVNKVVANITTSFVGAYNISCHGKNDGTATAIATSGTAPYTFNWNTGSNFTTIIGLSPGNYVLAATDNIGCTATATTTITQPPPIVIGTEATDVNCRLDSSGMFSLITTSGLVSPAIIDFGGELLEITSLPMQFDSLLAGTYPMMITDENGCNYMDTIVINPPTPIIVDLGDDRKVLFGDSAQLLPIITNTDNFTFSWNNTEGFSDPSSLTPYITPFLLANITLSVEDTITGCIGMDSIKLQFEKSRRFFYPTVFMAGTSGQNGYFILYFGAEVAHINFTRVYNRWGELLFEDNDMEPNNFLQGWDGTFKGRLMEVGVYTYVVEAVFIDGSTELFSGDITLIR